MMRVEPCKEDPNLNIMLRSEITTDDDKGKWPEEDGWVRKAPEKEVGFDLECMKEMFMEVKKSFTEASPSEMKENFPEIGVPTKVDPFVLTTFLETWMKLLWDSKAMKGIQELINKCVGKENAPEGHCVVQKIGKHKARTQCEMRLTTQIRDYEREQVILDMGSDANILPKHTSERMGRHAL